MKQNLLFMLMSFSFATSVGSGARTESEGKGDTPGKEEKPYSTLDIDPRRRYREQDDLTHGQKEEPAGMDEAEMNPDRRRQDWTDRRDRGGGDDRDDLTDR